MTQILQLKRHWKAPHWISPNIDSLHWTGINKSKPLIELMRRNAGLNESLPNRIHPAVSKLSVTPTSDLFWAVIFNAYFTDRSHVGFMNRSLVARFCFSDNRFEHSFLY